MYIAIKVVFTYIGADPEYLILSYNLEFARAYITSIIMLFIWGIKVDLNIAVNH